LTAVLLALLQVGAALSQLIAEGTVKREDFFITTKLW
jgi:diketogulonate reductase-like aldo/keto reductase